MPSAPDWLLRLSVHQDYFWFAALLGWSLASVLWWWHPRRQTTWVWVPWAAGAALLTAAIQFGIYNPPFDFFHDRLVPGTVLDYRPALISAGLLGDLLTGLVLSALAGGWWWTATRHRLPPWANTLPFAAATLLAMMHALRPGTATFLLSLGLILAGAALSRLPGADRRSRLLLALTCLAFVCSPIGPVAAHLDALPRDRPPHPVSLMAAAISALAGGLLLFGLRRDTLRSSGIPSLGALWRSAGLIVSGSTLWLVAGLFYAHQTGYDYRHELLENRLRTTAARAVIFPGHLLSPLTPESISLRSITPPRGKQPGRAEIPALASEAGQKLRAALFEEMNSTPFVDRARLVVVQDGWLVALASSRPQADPGRVELLRRATPADLQAWAEGRHYVEASPAHEIGTPYFARAALRDTTGRMRGWLEFDRKEFFQSIERKWRTGPLLVTSLGLVLTSVLFLQRRVAQEREAALRAAAVAAEANRLKTTFLAKVSHELRTPIQSLLGYSELLRRQLTGDPRSLAWLNAIHQHGELMTRLVNDLIDLSAVEAGSFRLNTRSADLRSLVSQTVDSLRPRAELKLLELHCEIAEDVPRWVKLDAERVRQVLINLVGNAIKFTERGFVRVSLQAIGPDSTASRFVLRVQDSGPGIPPGEQDRLFNAFSRLDSTAHQEGSGLGLALSAALCQTMGGGIAVESDGLTGSTFIASFTASITTAPDHASAPASGPVTPGLHGRTVLVVDDNTLVRELFVAAIHEAGGICTTAAGIGEAVTAATHTPFDIVLIDLSLPDGSGMSLAARLRHQQPMARLIGVSAHASAADRELALAAGMHAFLGKPVSLDDLVTAMLGSSPGTPPVHLNGSSTLPAALDQHFRAELPARREALSAAIAARDWDRSRAAAHYLANSAAAIGDNALLSACVRLVHAAEAGEGGAVWPAWIECDRYLSQYITPPSGRAAV